MARMADLVTIKTRVSRPVMDALSKRAAANERSVAAEIRVALSEHLRMNGASVTEEEANDPFLAA